MTMKREEVLEPFIVPFAGKVSFTWYAGPGIEDGTTTVKITPVVPAPTSGGAAVKAVDMK